VQAGSVQRDDAVLMFMSAEHGSQCFRWGWPVQIQ